MTANHPHPAENDVRTGAHIESSRGTHHDDTRDPAGLDIGLIALVGIVGTIIVYVTVLACTAAFYAIRQDRMEAMWVAPPTERRQYLAGQEQRLTGYHWIDKDKGVVSIPIEQAMDIVAAGGLESSR